jgi:hypothetical protein
MTTISPTAYSWLRPRGVQNCIKVSGLASKRNVAGWCVLLL